MFKLNDLSNDEAINRDQRNKQDTYFFYTW